MRSALVITIALVIALVACSKDGKGATSRDGVIAAWKKGGFEPSAFTAAKTSIGKDCATGTVEKLEVMLCSFGSEKEAADAEAGSYEWIGNATGVAKVQGKMLIVVADRKKADVNGKVAKQLITLPAE